MANRPANAGSAGVGSGRGLAPLGDAAPPFDAAPPPPPVHHDAIPRSAAPSAAAPSAAAPSAAAPSAAVPSAAPRPPAGHRAAPPGDRAAPGTSGLAWLPYLIVLAGTGVGMFVACQGSKYAGRGTGLVGCSLLAAALARLILPARYAGLLSSRRKASDVLAFAVLGAAVLAVALTLP